MREERKQYKIKMEKLYRSKAKELSDLRDKKYELGYVKLDEPIRYGYLKTFTLNRTALNSNISSRLQRLLDKFNSNMWSEKKEFLYTKDNIPYFNKSIKIGDKIILNTLTIYCADYLYPDFKQFSSDLRKYLIAEMGVKHTYFGNIPRWEITIDHKYVSQYFKEKIIPYYITERRILDPELESAIKILEDWTYTNEKWCTKRYKNYDCWNGHKEKKVSQIQWDDICIQEALENRNEII